MAFFVIGDSDTVLGYRLAGVAGAAVENPEQTRAAFQGALRRPGCAVLLVTREAAGCLEPDLAVHRRAGRAPFVAIVTETRGRREDGPSLEAMIQGAIGIRTT